jgi:hypothetical protein
MGSMILLKSLTIDGRETMVSSIDVAYFTLNPPRLRLPIVEEGRKVEFTFQNGNAITFFIQPIVRIWTPHTKADVSFPLVKLEPHSEGKVSGTSRGLIRITSFEFNLQHTAFFDF